MNPSLNRQAVEALVVNFFRRGQVELRPERLVGIGDAGLGAAFPVIHCDRKQVADHNRRRDQRNRSARIGWDGEIEHRLIASSNFGNRAGLRIHANQRRASLLCHDVEEPATVRRPVKRRAAASARGRVVAENGIAHVEVVARGKVAGLRIGS